MRTSDDRTEDSTPIGSLEHALTVAERIHRNQTDKLGAPYMRHVERVVERVAAIAPPELLDDCRVAAALHDTVEDSEGPWTLADIAAAGFSPEVVSAVDSVSKRPGEDYTDLIHRAGQDPVGRWVKLADNLDNADPERAAALEPETRQRLATKYADARRVLAGYGAVVPDDRQAERDG